MLSKNNHKVFSFQHDEPNSTHNLYIRYLRKISHVLQIQVRVLPIKALEKRVKDKHESVGQDLIFRYSDSMHHCGSLRLTMDSF